MKFLAGLFLWLLATPIWAQEIAYVPLPRPRPDVQNNAARRAVSPNTDRQQASVQASTRTYQSACPIVLSGQVEAALLPPIEQFQCGLQTPFQVTGVHVGNRRVKFSAPVTVNCQMAGELAAWVAEVNIYTKTMLNASIDTMFTGTSYLCRPRNGVQGADISEHGFGNALDITGFGLVNGRRIGLPQNWAGDQAEAKTMRFAHDAACAHFTTVLGPDVNELHEDHLHVDLGCHGRTCSVRVCE